ncbi:hypothetical protein [Sulfurimonas sp. HSL3-7]|uniref:hypothetical protein n=1 Tax=Sulfonitrofixus jiaomeiensis TaxID=3131938 RepID=UPI0031F9936E
MKYLLILSFITSLLIAAPAFHGKRTFTQPDGTVVEYRAQGDEHLHWNETENGDILLYSKKNKRMEFAEIKNGTLQPSGIAYSKSETSKAPSATPRKLTKEEISELHKKRRDEHLSKMKSRHDHPHH